LNATEYAPWVDGSTRDKLTQNKMGSILLPTPPLRQQRAIADFLDREAGRIDGLASSKHCLIDLLAEKRKAIIASAVTRGIEPRANLRDSGVPWLRKIPEHWEVERARWLFRERDVRSTTGDEELLTVSHITGVTPRSEKDVNMFEAETNEGYKLCEPCDLVINTLWAWMGAMGVAPVKGIVSPAYNVYEPGKRLLPEYIDELVRLPVFAQEVTRYSKGVWSSRLRLYPEGFFETCLPVPPMDEQKTIVEHIARETAKLDNVRAATGRTIALLKERRAALIAAAVTGQIDASGTGLRREISGQNGESHANS
jgi:type I restriction enzyme S subunit